MVGSFMSMATMIEVLSTAAVTVTSSTPVRRSRDSAATAVGAEASAKLAAKDVDEQQQENDGHPDQ